jgi:hypothetical protein
LALGAIVLFPLGCALPGDSFTGYVPLSDSTAAVQQRCTDVFGVSVPFHAQGGLIGIQVMAVAFALLAVTLAVWVGFAGQSSRRVG